MKEKNQQNEDNLMSHGGTAIMDDAACSICGSADYAFVALICDGCENVYHTHCIGLDGVPDCEFWYCDACKDNNIAPNDERRKQRRRRRRSYANKNNAYDLNDSALFSQNERNPEWLTMEDEEWKPGLSSSSDDDAYGYDDRNCNKNRKRKRKRKRKRTCDEFEGMNKNKKRRKLNDNESESYAWICKMCTFKNSEELSTQCSMCHTERKEKEKKKYSSTNPYRSRTRTLGNRKQNEKRQCSVNSLVGEDILAMIGGSTDEDDDIKDITLSVTNHRNSKAEFEDALDSDLDLKPKPKAKFRDRFNKIYSPNSRG